MTKKIPKKIRSQVKLAISIFKDLEKGKIVSDIAKDYLETINERIGDRYQQIFGDSAAPWEQWVSNRKAAEAANSARAESLRKSSALKSFDSKVLNIYKKYWDERLSDIEDLYMSSWGLSNYTRQMPYKHHYKRKRRHFGSRAEHNGQPISFLRPTMMTGFLKQSLYNSISNGGDEYLDILNNPLAMSSRFNPDAYPSGPRSGGISYVRLFWNTANATTGLDAEELFSLSDDYWVMISKEVDALVEAKIIPEFREAAK